ncbi:hypothetical protein ACJZ2D_006494 [Fusarium nematophilum]
MSTTTTTTQASRHLQNAVLADYELHHSQTHRESQIATPRQPQSNVPLAHQWDVTHRRVPAYRAINRERDQSEVRVYTSTIERVFITVMFGGLFINAGAAQLWRASFGKLGDRVFRYPIGGEL